MQRTGCGDASEKEMFAVLLVFQEMVVHDDEFVAVA